MGSRRNTLSKLDREIRSSDNYIIFDILNQAVSTAAMTCEMDAFDEAFAVASKSHDITEMRRLMSTRNSMFARHGSEYKEELDKYVKNEMELTYGVETFTEKKTPVSTKKNSKSSKTKAASEARKSSQSSAPDKKKLKTEVADIPESSVSRNRSGCSRSSARNSPQLVETNERPSSQLGRSSRLSPGLLGRNEGSSQTGQSSRMTSSLMPHEESGPYIPPEFLNRDENRSESSLMRNRREQSRPLTPDLAVPRERNVSTQNKSESFLMRNHREQSGPLTPDDLAGPKGGNVSTHNRSESAYMGDHCEQSGPLTPDDLTVSKGENASTQKESESSLIRNRREQSGPLTPDDLVVTTQKKLQSSKIADTGSIAFKQSEYKPTLDELVKKRRELSVTDEQEQDQDSTENKDSAEQAQLQITDVGSALDSSNSTTSMEVLEKQVGDGEQFETVSETTLSHAISSSSGEGPPLLERIDGPLEENFGTGQVESD